MRTLHLHNSISIKQILFLWLAFCMLPGLAQATGSYFGNHKSAHHTFDHYKRLYKSDGHRFKRCNKSCDNILTIPLLVDQTTQVGVIKVSYDEYNLNIKYVANDGWRIEKTRLAVSDSFEGLPQNRYGEPNLQRFPNSTSHRIPVQTVNHMLSANRWPVGTELYIAAQASLVSIKPRDHLDTRMRANSSSHNKNQYKDRDDDGQYNDMYNRYRGSRNNFRFLKSLFKEKYQQEKHRHNAKCRWGKNHDKDDSTRHRSVSAWAQGFAFPGGNVGFYFTYLLSPCKPVADSSIEFSNPVYISMEGNSVARITINRTGNLSKPASARFKTSDGTAVEGVDYIGVDEIVSFNPGVTQMLVTVPVIDDSSVEDVETVNLQLLDASGATLGELDTAVLEIGDNDELPPRFDSFVFEPAEYIARESDDKAVITVKRIGSLVGEATVDFAAIGGSAKNGMDYELMPGTLVFADGTDSATITLTIREDRAPEGDESVIIGLTNPINAILGDPYEALLVIEDNEGPN